MSQLLNILAPLGIGGGKADSHLDDDFVDRLNRSYTTLMFIVFCILVKTKQYVGEPIHCWVPGHFTSNYASYTNKICWVSNTYYLPPKDGIPEQTPEQMINYYQWIPMFMIFQALFFYMPYLVWRVFSKRSGIDLANIIEAGRSCHRDNKDKTMRFMLHQMDQFLGHFRSSSRGCCTDMKSYLASHCNLICGKKYGNYMVTVYLTVKCLYLINCVSQLFVLNAFLSADFHIYGFQMMKAMSNNEDWPAAKIFPRTTMCDFEVRALGNTHRHTVQCVLSINFFNEKIYMIIWCWLVLLSIITAMSLVLWITRSVFHLDQMHYIKRHLRYANKLQRSEDKKLVTKFVKNYLRQDGIVVIRLLNSNVNSITVADFVAELWDNFVINPKVGCKPSEKSSIALSDVGDV